MKAKEFPFLVLDNNAERVALAHTHGYQALMGDAGEEATLSEAHIERAVVFATVLPNDMVNVFITLTARNMRPDAAHHRARGGSRHGEEAEAGRRE